jgi:hypothetical protein
LAPPLPPHLEHPFLQPSSFEQEVSNKLHSNLVIQKQPPKLAPKAIHTFPLPASCSIIAAMNAHTVAQAAPFIPHRLPVLASISDQITIKGSKEKRRILDTFEKEFGSNKPNSIITRKKGKHKYSLPLDPQNCMRPSLNKYYRVEESTLHNVMTLVLKEYGTFTNQELLHIRC